MVHTCVMLHSGFATTVLRSSTMKSIALTTEPSFLWSKLQLLMFVLKKILQKRYLIEFPKVQETIRRILPPKIVKKIIWTIKLNSIQNLDVLHDFTSPYSGKIAKKNPCRSGICMSSFLNFWFKVHSSFLLFHQNNLL